MNQIEEESVDKRLIVLVLLCMGSFLPMSAISDSTGDSVKTDQTVTTKKAVGAATSVIGGKKAAAVKAIDRATGGQVTEGAKQGAQSAAETVKEGVDKVTDSSAGQTELKKD